MKDWLQKAQISNPKCAIYMAIGGLQIMVAGDYQWTEVCLASLIRIPGP